MRRETSIKVVTTTPEGTITLFNNFLLPTDVKEVFAKRDRSLKQYPDDVRLEVHLRVVERMSRRKIKHLEWIRMFYEVKAFQTRVECLLEEIATMSDIRKIRRLVKGKHIRYQEVKAL